MTEGKLLISLDTEIAWGRVGHSDQSQLGALYQKTKEVIRRLIELFDKYDIPVTWAVVGRLVDKRNANDQAIRGMMAEFYPGIEPNEYEGDFYSFPDLMDLLAGSTSKPEVTSHSYSHIVYGDADATLAETDLSEAGEVLKQHQLSPATFIFPRNSIDHLEAVKAAGFSHYRRKGQSWLDRIPGKLRQVSSLLDILLPIAPEVGKASLHQTGLIGVPGGLLFRKSNLGLRKIVPVSALKRKALLGLKKAVRKREIFHLWFHPFNFAYDSENHFKEFEKVLQKADELRKSGELEILTVNRVKIA
ncbi:MAG: polysaccharide deacetylase family protein [Roseivirga sp.]|nr:polysaccharide deacetylase family protein [Roseivirga sp.]